jgi:ribosomal protein S18 acetylase RimI-like enzyme
VQIRLYDNFDQGAVIALWNEILLDNAPHNDPATSIRSKIIMQDKLFYVAVTEGMVVGTVMGGYDGHRGWIYSLAVDLRFRRQKIGTALIRQIESILQERGCLKVNLQVRTSNASVIAFYKRLGFQIEERVSMGKRLYGGAQLERTSM